jgi:hypothetical protein
MRISTVLFILAACACGPRSISQAPSFNARDSSLAGYVVSNSDLGAVAIAIDDVMRPVTSDDHRDWIGVNPERSAASDEVAVFVVDSARLVRDGCAANPLSARCRVGRLTADGCAALDQRTIMCDAKFLLITWSLAARSVDETALRNTPGEREGRMRRFDDYFARVGLLTLPERVLEAKRYLERARRNADYASKISVFFGASLSLVMWHEYGHIALGHVKNNVLGDEARVRTTDWMASGPEADADEYAIKKMAQHLPPPVVATSITLLTDLESYWRRTIALAAGFKDGRIEGVTPAEEERAEFAAAATKSGICASSHPSYVARLVRITRSPAFQPAMAYWPKGYFDAAAKRADRWNRMCMLDEWFQAQLAGSAEGESQPERLAELRIIDPGSAPRSRLRYSWRKGSIQRTRITVHGEERRAIDGAPLKDTKDDSVTEVVLKVVDVDAEARHFFVAIHPVKSTLKALQVPVMIAWAFNDLGGAASEVDVATRPVAGGDWKSDPQVAGFFRSFVELTPGVIMLPVEEIGAGGSWSITTPGRPGDEASTTIWKLVSRDGDRLTLEGTMGSVISRPDGSSTLKGEGPVSATVDLRFPSPRFSSRLQFTTVVSAGPQNLTYTRLSTVDREPL